MILGDLILDGLCKIISLRDRFWSKVQKTSGCWNWIGGILALIQTLL